MKIVIISIIAIPVLIIVIATTLLFPVSKVVNDSGLVACTMEAKLCPDGTSVGRIGPKCEFAECPSINQNKTVKINQKTIINNLTITPLSIVSDSRCPKGVQCIWAGTVTLKVRIEKNGVLLEKIVELGKTVDIQGNQLVLSEVLPDKAQTEISDSEYSFVFKVKEINTAMVNVSGRVTISPVCPVERIPPEPGCSPKGYKTTVSIFKTGESGLVKTVTTDKNGNFTLELKSGVYDFVAQSAQVFPKCSKVTASVTETKNSFIDVSCDSGIR